MSWTFRKILSFRTEFLHQASLRSSPRVFSIQHIWDHTRMTYPVVDWHKVLWFPLHIPKHSTITWMVVLDRLPTKTRMACWGYNIDTVCLLCGIGTEHRDHLFLECPYSTWVWNSILCGLTSHLKGKSLLVLILKLAWSCFVYLIWRERNNRMFEARCSDPDSILEEVKFHVRAKLSRASINTSDPLNFDLCRQWNLVHVA